MIYIHIACNPICNECVGSNTSDCIDCIPTGYKMNDVEAYSGYICTAIIPSNYFEDVDRIILSKYLNYLIIIIII